MSRLFIIVILSCFLLGCSDQNTNRISEEEFVSFVEKNLIGKSAISSDYWMEKRLKSGQVDDWAKVILVFGYVDNFENCEELSRYFNQTYDQIYRCVPANKYQKRTRASI
jgi:hypothetical protein